MLYFSLIKMIILVLWFLCAALALKLTWESAAINLRFKWIYYVAALFVAPLVLLLLVSQRRQEELKARIREHFARKQAERDALLRVINPDGMPPFTAAECEEFPAWPIMEKELKNLLTNALRKNMSDIFIDPMPNGMYCVSFKGGNATKNIFLDKDNAGNLFQVVKKASFLNRNDTTRPQNGNFYFQSPAGSLKVGVVTLGTLNGEKMALHPEKVNSVPYFANGFFPKGQLPQIRKAVGSRSGLITVCGGRGFDMTDTIHALIAEMNCAERTVVSIEKSASAKPISGISQVVADNIDGVTVGVMLESLLKQNADVICINSLDADSAAMAIQAVQNNKLVIAAVDAGDNLGVLDRLMSFGIRMNALAPLWLLSINQKSVRKLCYCRRSVAVPEEFKQYFAKLALPLDKVAEPVGCSDCNNSGYRGVLSVFDLLRNDDFLKIAMSADGATLTTIQERSNVKHGSMFKECIRLAADGFCSIEDLQAMLPVRTVVPVVPAAEKMPEQLSPAASIRVPEVKLHVPAAAPAAAPETVASGVSEPAAPTVEPEKKSGGFKLNLQ